jgi:photosystem II stability/assembly factor-like uncharacterized protein
MVKVSLTLLVLFALNLRLRAGEDAEWESHGPYGGLAFSIQVDAKRVLVYTTRGSFLSTDGGATWKRIIPPKGVIWYRHIAITGGKFYCGHEKSLYISKDGTSWKKEVDLEGNFLALTNEPGKPEKTWCLYMVENELRASRKVGQKWETTRIRTMPDFVSNKYSNYSWNLIISPSNPSIMRVFVRPFDPKTKTIVIGSDDGGKNWEYTTIDAIPVSAHFSLRESRTIYAAAWKQPGKMSGLLRSKDGGKTWELLNSDKRICSLRSLIIHPKTGHLYLGSTDNGLFKAANEGKKLIELNKGLFNKNVSAIAAHPNDKNVLYAGTQYGIFKSTDGGNIWKWISEGVAGCQTTDIITLDDYPDRLLFFEFHQGLRTSTDGGKTWSPPRQVEGGARRTYQAWCGEKKILVHTNTNKGSATLLSTDMGRTWSSAQGLGDKDYPVGVVSDTEMYAAHDFVHLFKSTDGLTWKHFAEHFEEIGGAISWVGKPIGRESLLVGGGEAVVKCNRDSGKKIAWKPQRRIIEMQPA